MLLLFQILQTLSIQGAGSTGSSDLSSSGVSRAMIKERLVPWPLVLHCSDINNNWSHKTLWFCLGRFKSFNMQFEELHAKQSQWIVPDQELRESLRLAVAEVLLPAYRSFVKRFGCVNSHFSSSPYNHNFFDICAKLKLCPVSSMQSIYLASSEVFLRVRCSILNCNPICQSPYKKISHLSILLNDSLSIRSLVKPQR
jgi:hypothetical protein